MQDDESSGGWSLVSAGSPTENQPIPVWSATQLGDRIAEARTRHPLGRKTPRERCPVATEGRQTAQLTMSPLIAQGEARACGPSEDVAYGAIETGSDWAIAQPADVDPYWGFKWADQLTLAPTRWLVRSLIPEDCTGVLYGASGSLKTFVMLDMALNIANGTPWQDKATKQRTVFYLAGEGEQGFAKRIKAWVEVNGGSERNLAFRQMPRIRCARDLAQLITTIRRLADDRGQAGLIVIDTLFTALDGGEENSGKDMGEIIGAMKRLRQEFQAAVMAVHHTGHDKDAKGRARGHSSLPSGMDVMLHTRLGPTPLSVELSNPKQKDGAEHPPMLIGACVHNLAITGEDGTPETSLVITRPSANLLAAYQDKSQQIQDSIVKRHAAKRDYDAAADSIKTLAVRRLAQGAFLDQVETEVAQFAQDLGYPGLARKKSTLANWKKQAGL